MNQCTPNRLTMPSIPCLSMSIMSAEGGARTGAGGGATQLSTNKVSPLISGVVNKWTMCFLQTKLKVMGRKGGHRGKGKTSGECREWEVGRNEADDQEDT